MMPFLFYTLILITAIWNMAVAEAQYYHWNRVYGPFADSNNEKWVLTIIRFCLFAFYYKLTHWMPAVGMCALFIFIHDGVLYSRRHKLDDRIYHGGFWAEPSKEDQSFFSFNVTERLIAAILGVIILFIYTTWVY